MGFLSRLAGLFSRGSRDENLLLEGIEHAKGKRPEKAIEIYNALLAVGSTAPSVKARALFNRALAHSSLDDDAQALADLQKLLAMPGLSENVQSAARAQVARVKKRAE